MKLKIKHLFCAALAGALALITHNASAQWQTVDNYQYAAGQSAANQGLTVAPNGFLFAAGWANNNDPDYTGHALIMASTDGGKTWSAPVDDFSYATGDSSYYNAVASDSVGNLYGAGGIDDGITYGPSAWFVRGSGDGGVSWSTLDFISDEYEDAIANSIAADGAGNVYVAGIVGDSWVVRKGTAGKNFSTVDAFRTTGWDNGALAIFVHPTAGIFAAGVGPISTNTVKSGKTVSTVVYYGWVVRRSTDGGATWSTVDRFSLSGYQTLPSGYQTVPRGIGADAHGNIYVVGSGITVSGTGKNQTTSSHWLVRKSGNGGSSWATVDDLQLSHPYPLNNYVTAFAADANGNLFVAGLVAGSGWIVRENPGGTGTWQTVDNLSGAFPFAITADASGHVFVGGTGTDSAGVEHWLVRKH